MTKFFGTTGTIRSDADLEKWDRWFEKDASRPSQWAFRGHKDLVRGLSTKLELAFNRHRIPNSHRERCERLLIREFGRKAYLYLPASELPEPDDTLEWLSLMRHYGAPTRLLDWTYSIFVAAFFALAASDRGERCWIWAIDTRWLNSVANARVPGLAKHQDKTDLDKTGKHFRELFLSNSTSFVSTESPLRINKRLALQRGVFLCPGDVRKSFVDNLEALSNPGKRARLLCIRPSARDSLLRLLYRLNIDEEVIFPGIEGLGTALRDRLPRIADASSLGKTINLERIGRMGGEIDP